jgi:hypothetical protein
VGSQWYEDKVRTIFVASSPFRLEGSSSSPFRLEGSSSSPSCWEGAAAWSEEQRDFIQAIKTPKAGRSKISSPGEGLE